MRAPPAFALLLAVGRPAPSARAAVVHFHQPRPHDGRPGRRAAGRGAARRRPRLLDQVGPEAQDRPAHWQVYFDARSSPLQCTEVAAAANASHCSAVPISGAGPGGGGAAHLVFATPRALLGLRPAWAEELAPAHKLHADLRPPQPAAAAGEAAGAGRRPALYALHALPPGPSAEAAARRWAAALRDRGISVTHLHHTPGKLRVDLVTREDLPRAAALLAALPEVRWLEPRRGFRPLNNVATWTVQSDEGGKRGPGAADTPLNGLGLNGTGELLHVGDTGLDHDSCFFHDPSQRVTYFPQMNPRHRKVLTYVECVNDDGVRFHEDRAGAHGTHVSGSAVGASLTPRMAAFNGLASGAKLYLTDMACNEPDLWLPNDLGDYFRTAWLAGARVGLNSWGTSAAPLKYESTDRETDQFAFLHPQYLVVFAAGNEPTGGILSPANAKNALTIGAHVNSPKAQAREDLAKFSATGPTWDRRVKPELLAPGEPVVSASSDGKLDSHQCNTQSKQGTSMAAPFAAAAAVILRQYFRQGWYPSGKPDLRDAFDPSAALLKCLLIHSARPITGIQGHRREHVGTPPNSIQGFGRLALQDILHFDHKKLQSELFLVNNVTLLQDERFDACFRTATAGRVRATLVWMDPPAADGASRTILNDLDLALHRPTGKVEMGNHGRDFDRNAVVEQGEIAEAAPGVYRASVYGWRVAEHAPYLWGLPFSLVVSGPGISHIPECVGAGLPCPSDQEGRVCSGHGRCDGTDGVCICERGWHHLLCSHCSSKKFCSGHGACDPKTMKCACDYMWTGPQCDRCVAGWHGPRCDNDCRCGDGRGRCDPATGRCVCGGNWGGLRCEKCAKGWRGGNCTVPSHWCEDKKVVEIDAARERQGWIQINGERSYRNSMKCQWRIRAGPGMRVRIKFTRFVLEQSFDWVSVFDGFDRSARRVAHRAGKAAEWDVDATSGTAFVLFESDLYDAGGQEGFEASFEVLGSTE